ncbi:MAG: YdiU family protein [Desulfohalobiaceae bacterium]
MFQFDNTYARLPEAFYARVAPAQIPKPELIKWNADLARQLGAQDKDYSDTQLAKIFSGQSLIAGSEPIAMAYAGHQFGNFVPKLGDGRALLLGEVLDPSGGRHDIQLKGSGRTPFSRSGDGKAPLGPVLREYIVSEALHHLGMPTTRSLAAVKTGEPVHREKALPGAILTRVASSHIRVGTFEYFASKQDLDNLRRLTDYSIQRHYPEIQHDSKAYLQFFRKVGEAQVELVTGWMALGFIHGVMNTDNMSIAGESIDFGPCAFMDQFRFDQVFSSIDQFGRYSYSNQAQITLWNLSRLGSCLLLLSQDASKDGTQDWNQELEAIRALFEHRHSAKMLEKLGIFDGKQAGDRDLIQKWLGYLEAENLDYTLSFRALALLVDQDSSVNSFKRTEAFQDFYQLWQKRIHQQGLAAEAIQKRMNLVNPVFIPRNHKIEEVIEAGLQDDFSLFHQMNQALQSPYEEQQAFSSYQSAPEPEDTVRATFCGT